MKFLRGFFVLCLTIIPVASRAASPTVAAIRKAGVLTCGIDRSDAEFSMNDEHGPRVAFDSDLCKAVAVAILGPRAHIAIKGYPDDDDALQALLKNLVDLVPSVSDDFSRSTLPDVDLTRPVLLDGLGLLVPRTSGITHAAELSNKKVCFLAETEAEINLRSWFTGHQLTLIAFPFQEEGEMEAAFVTGNCAALAGDLTRLARARTSFGARARDYEFLPEVLSADPLASAYRAGDPEFGNIIAWTENVLLAAEAMHINSANISALKFNTDPAVRRLLGETHELGRPLGLNDDWPAQVIEAVGNYRELFDRDLGAASPLQMPRGPNNLWTGGGLMQPLPFK